MLKYFNSFSVTTNLLTLLSISKYINKQLCKLILISSASKYSHFNTFLHSLAVKGNIFCKKFIQVQDSIKKDEKLVKALVELISEDETIPDEQKFYVEEDGGYISKKQLLERCYFCFQSFLLVHYSQASGHKFS